jgi:hypothetical protein
MGLITILLLVGVGLVAMLTPFLIDGHHWWPRKPQQEGQNASRKA